MGLTYVVFRLVLQETETVVIINIRAILGDKRISNSFRKNSNVFRHYKNGHVQKKHYFYLPLKQSNPFMKEKEIRLVFNEYNSLSEMEDNERILIEKAIEAGRKAYAPYSRFQVGAALLLEDGTVVTGANVENAAFPSGSCAEKTAIGYAVSNYPGIKPVAIAVAARTENGLTNNPIPPCGNCRQMLLEEEHRNNKTIKVILYGTDKIVVTSSSEQLMPLQFNRENLNS